MVRLSGETIPEMINRMLAVETDKSKPQAALSVISLNANPGQLYRHNLYGKLTLRSQLLKRRPTCLVEQADWMFQCSQVAPELKPAVCRKLIVGARQILDALVPLCPGDENALRWRLNQLSAWEEQNAA